MDKRYWDRHLAAIEKRKAIRDAESQGLIADSMEVRGDLIRRAEAGEFPPEELHSRLAAIKRAAKKNGLRTRSQVWRQS